MYHFIISASRRVIDNQPNLKQQQKKKSILPKLAVGEGKKSQQTNLIIHHAELFSGHFEQYWLVLELKSLAIEHPGHARLATTFITDKNNSFRNRNVFQL